MLITGKCTWLYKYMPHRNLIATFVITLHI